MQLQKAVLDALYLFNQSPDHRIYTLVEFNIFATYPILHEKCRLFYDGSTPIGFVSWVWLTEQEGLDFLAERFVPDEETYKRPNDISANLHLWGVEFIAPFGHAHRVMRAMRHYSQDILGQKEPAHWRRLKQPDRLHKKGF